MNEVFPNPTVKQVIFQMRYPNLFFLESKIGDFQIQVMKEFPESAQVIRRRIVFADAEESKLRQLIEEQKSEDDPTVKIWQFRSKQQVEVQVSTSSLSITSDRHKTYDTGDAEKFRDVIEFVTAKFLAVAAVPLLTRVGLRYLDECPVPDRKSDTFAAHYNTAFPLARFALEHVSAMSFAAVATRDGCQLRYAENLTTEHGQFKLRMDFDAYTENVDADKILAVTDTLHKQTSEEFFRTVKEPVIQWMRKPKPE